MKITAFVASGSLVSIDQCSAIDKALNRQVNWQEVQGSRDEAGNFFQAYYEADVFESEYKIAKDVIERCREEAQDSR